MDLDELKIQLVVLIGILGLFYRLLGALIGLLFYVILGRTPMIIKTGLFYIYSC